MMDGLCGLWGYRVEGKGERARKGVELDVEDMRKLLKCGSRFVERSLVIETAASSESTSCSLCPFLWVWALVIHVNEQFTRRKVPLKLKLDRRNATPLPKVGGFINIELQQ